MNYILRAPNGDWLVLKYGARDHLLAVCKSKRAATALKSKLDRQQ